MFIRYDGNHPGIIEGKDKRPLEMFDTNEGFRVYVTDDIELVGNLCIRSSAKYRLFRSATFKVKIKLPNSSMTFEDLVSWNYRKVTVDTRRVDNDGQRIYETKIEWYQHGPDEICEASEAAVTGKRPKDEPEVYGVLKERNDEIAKLKEVVMHQGAQIRGLEAQVKDLTEMNQALTQALNPPLIDAAPDDGPLEEVAFGGVGALPDTTPLTQAPVAQAPAVVKKRGRPAPAPSAPSAAPSSVE
jgi:hypothetical protein